MLNFQRPLEGQKIEGILNSDYIVQQSAPKPVEPHVPPEVEALINKAKETTDPDPAVEPKVEEGFKKPVEAIRAEVDDLVKQFTDKEPPVEDDAVDLLAGTPAAPAALEPEGVDGDDDGSGNGQEDEVGFVALANKMQEDGLITEIPETVDPSNLTIESFWELVNHNLKKKEVEEYSKGQQAGWNDLAGRMSPATVAIMQFNLDNPNVSDEETLAFADSIQYGNNISQLDTANIFEAEQIMREYLRSIGHAPAEIDTEVEEARELNKLENRAQMYKPKLELKIKQERDAKAQQAAEIKRQDSVVENHFLDRLESVLKKGEIKGVKIGPEEQQLIWGVLSANNVPVQVKGGRQVELGYFEHLARKHRFAQDGDLEALAIATLVLEGKHDVLKKFYATPAVKQEVTKFVQGAKNNTFKAGAVPERQAKSGSNKNLNDKNAFFSALRG